MLPILFHLGRVNFYSFGTFIALGAIIAGVFVNRAARLRKLKTHYLFDTVLFTLLISLVAARLTYFFLYADQFQGISQLFKFWQGGLVALGGLVAGFLTYLYFVKREHDPLWQMLDIGALSLMLGWTIGKTGCFLSGCTIGAPATGFFAIHGSYPVDLYSAIWAAFVFIVMTLIWLRNRLSDGVVFFLVIEALLLGQLLIDTLNADFGGSLTRVEALVYLALVVLLYLVFWKMHGPKIEKTRWGVNIKNFVFRRKT